MGDGHQLRGMGVVLIVGVVRMTAVRATRGAASEPNQCGEEADGEAPRDQEKDGQLPELEQVVEVLLQGGGVEDAVEPTGLLEQCGVEDGEFLKDSGSFFEQRYDAGVPFGDDVVLPEGDDARTPEGSNLLVIEGKHFVAPEGNNVILPDGVDVLVIQWDHLGPVEGFDVLIPKRYDGILPEWSDVGVVDGKNMLLISRMDGLYVELLEFAFELLDQGDDLILEILEETWARGNGFTWLR